MSSVLLLPEADSPPSTTLPWQGPQRIEGFTSPRWRHLAEVPIGPTGPADENRFDKWRLRQEYAEQLRGYRLELLHDLKDNKPLQTLEREKCAFDPAYFISVYGWIVEPRRRKASISGLGGSGTKPWILVERQVQLIRWLRWVTEQDDENADGLISKCRDWGASWTVVADSIHRWTFEDYWTTLFLSKKEELVDSKSPKALFKKADSFLEKLPSFLRPPGFAPTRHRFFRHLQNPENGNTITGETTTQTSGRSDRVSEVVIDEAPLIDDLEHIWAGLTDVTDHRIALGSENLEHTTFFYDMRTSGEIDEHPAIFEADWWQLHDEEWHTRTRKRYLSMPNGEQHYQREIMRNPDAASNWVYPETRTMAPKSGLSYIPGMPMYVTIDPGFRDAAAIIYIQHNLQTGRYEVLDGYTNSQLPAAFYGPLITGKLADLEENPIIGEWQYGPREIDLITWVASWTGLPKYIGDTYGDTRDGATMDSWYSVWHRNHGIQINVDRLPSGKVAAHRMPGRTHVGRRDAARWILPQVDFADTIGARQCLAMLQNNSFGKIPTSGRLPESGMLRDQTTHFTSAFEFWAVNMKIANQLIAYANERASREAERDAFAERGHRFGRSSYQVFEPVEVR